MRRLAAAVLFATFVAPTASPAYADAYCHQLVDATNDATGFTNGTANPRGEDSGADIEWAGIATNRTYLGAWIKFYSFSAVDTSSPTGRRIDVTYKVRGVTKTFTILIDAQGVVTRQPATLAFKTVYDAPKFELHLWALLSSIGLADLKTASKKLHRPADTITSLSITTKRWAGDLSSGMQVGSDPIDTASATFVYPHLGVSCVKAGT